MRKIKKQETGIMPARMALGILELPEETLRKQMGDPGLLGAMAQLRSEMICLGVRDEMSSNPARMLSERSPWTSNYRHRQIAANTAIIRSRAQTLRGRLGRVWFEMCFSLAALGIAGFASWDARIAWLPNAIVAAISFLATILPRRGFVERFISVSTMSAAILFAQHWGGLDLTLGGVTSMAASLGLVLKVSYDAFKLELSSHDLSTELLIK